MTIHWDKLPNFGDYENLEELDSDVDKYQKWTERTAIYPTKESLYYTSLGLAGECGEVCNQVKKVIRDDAGVLTEERRQKLIDELGDLGWYFARFAAALNVSLSEVLERNMKKLESRLERNQLKGSGDNR
jgi:NTP pyrophosphatase (non-canonical NTP hydrolase)